MPIKVAVLCGGTSNEREISLLSGINVALSLDRERFKVSIIEINSQGKWFFAKYDEIRNKLIKIKAIESNRSNLRQFGVIFIALHGKLGEDGGTQTLLQSLGIHYTGSDAKANALAFNKHRTNSLLASRGILVPRSICIDIHKEDGAGLLVSIRNRIGLPYVVKPNQSGSSIGITIARKESDFLKAIEKAGREDKDVIVEEFIEGRELTCAVLGNRSTQCFALPPIEIIPHSEFFNYQAKYESKLTEEICPAPLSATTTQKVTETAIKIHKLLGCDGLTRSDFILTQDHKLYFLEINTVPGLTKMSLCPKAARAGGMSLGLFMELQIDLALNRQ